MLNDLYWFFITPNIINTFFVFLFSLLIGSFLNVLIYRIPENLKYDYYQALIEEDLIANNPIKKKPWYKRSHCFNCLVNIKWYHNVPIFSYLALKRKCNNCGTKISQQYFWVELITGLTITFFYVFLPFNELTFLLIIVLSVSIVLSFIDINEKLLPDTLIAIIAIVSLYITTNDHKLIDTQSFLLHLLLTFFTLNIFFKLYSKIRKIDIIIGDGDIKLISVLSTLLISIENINYFILLSPLYALVFIGYMFVTKIKNNALKEVFFGPFILLSFWTIMIIQLIELQIIK